MYHRSSHRSSPLARALDDSKPAEPFRRRRWPRSVAAALFPSSHQSAGPGQDRLYVKCKATSVIALGCATGRRNALQLGAAKPEDLRLQKVRLPRSLRVRTLNILL